MGLTTPLRVGTVGRAGAALLMAGAALWLWPRTSIEWLDGTARPEQIDGDQAISARMDGMTARLIARPIAGGPETEIAHQKGAMLVDWHAHAGRVSYLLLRIPQSTARRDAGGMLSGPEVDPSQGGPAPLLPRQVATGATARVTFPAGTAGVAAPPATKYLGVFAAPAASAGLKGVRRTPSLDGFQSGGSTLDLYTVDRPGAHPRRLESGVYGARVMVGDGLYWIDPRPDRKARAVRTKQTWTEVAGNSRIVRTSLIDRATRTVHADVPSDTQLMPLADGICWTERRPYPDSHIDLRLWRPNGDGGVLRGYGGGSRPPTAAGDRLCWFVSRTQPPFDDLMGRQWSPDELHSAGLDGSDERVERISARRPGRPVPWGPTTDRYLYADGGAVFCLLRDRPAVDPPPEEPTLRLCRLQTGAPGRWVEVAALPPRTSDLAFQGHYLYGVHAVETAGLLTGFTGSVSGPQFRNRAFRVRLASP
ncbi:MAG: hypothetical protein NT029_19435 [Armatimonadetes bacterium]|nr:hypothetical protein [Armatimonadota bacterium]